MILICTLQLCMEELRNKFLSPFLTIKDLNIELQFILITWRDMY